MTHRSEEKTPARIVEAIDSMRAEGVPVTAACRTFGVSTSTYYRRRRELTAEAPLEAAASVAAGGPAVETCVMRAAWPYVAAPKPAPHYWDQAFGGELSDSFVRRMFGLGSMASPPPLIASVPAKGRRASRPRQSRPSGNPLQMIAQEVSARLVRQGLIGRSIAWRRRSAMSTVLPLALALCFGAAMLSIAAQASERAQSQEIVVDAAADERYAAR